MSMYKMIGGDGLQYGPVTAEQMRQWLAEGRVDARTQVQPAGSAEWRPLAELPELLMPVAPPRALELAPITVPKTSGLAVAALVLGILGFCTWGMSGLVGLILGIIALQQIKRSNGALTGQGLAIGGVCTGGAALLMVPIRPTHWCCRGSAPSSPGAGASARSKSCSRFLGSA